MRDQLDCHFVRSRITGERSCGELGKLLVVALGKIRPDLPDVLLDDVEVVQQPISGRADVEAAFSAAVQLVIDAVEYFSRILETKKKRAGTPLFLRREQMMSARYGSRAFTKSLEAEYLAANRTDEFFARSVSRTAEQTTQNCCWSFGRDCCCHVTYSTPEVCRSRLGHARIISRFIYSA
jgi:hypothetical protein